MAAEPFLSQPNRPPAPPPDPAPPVSGPARMWADLVRAGWAEVILRYATHGLLLVGLLVLVLARQFNLGFLSALADKASLDTPPGAAAALAAPSPTPDPRASAEVISALPADLAAPTPTAGSVIERLADPYTLIPSRGRSDVITYTVKPGDTLFGIADNFGLQPETVLWGNYFVLKDDPHLLFPGQVLNILPTDGTYHTVAAGDTLEKIAGFYEVTPEAIVDWPSNNLDPSDPRVQVGARLVVPGGHRELAVWQVPTISRTDTPETAGTNFGQCPGGYSGAVGTGAFVWPANNHFLSGYDFTAIHHGLDLKAKLGDPLYAADSGVIVYAGPNAYGYGNLIVIDHGNGWQTVYGHLSQWNVDCGQSVFQGNLIGLAGSTGNSSGPHLHFEVRYKGAYVNPWTVLPPP
ncbi:MAG: peptidoglycan DD-metalloendopeptidase family protein [Anaerolineales bacterium]|nr:peptidoglycan DD-metalloendopeptidase family protein [Anaerolineales bacterium]